MYPNLPGQAQFTPPVHISLLIMPQETQSDTLARSEPKNKTKKGEGGKREVVLQRTILNSMASWKDHEQNQLPMPRRRNCPLIVTTEVAFRST